MGLFTATKGCTSRALPGLCRRLISHETATKHTTGLDIASLGRVAQLGSAGLPQIDQGPCSNQDLHTGNDATLAGLIGHFSAPLRFSFGYGSGVLRQAGYEKASTPQIDMLHIVDSAHKFHTTNLQQNPHHYLILGRLGPTAVCAVQKWGAGAYFNPYVSVGSGDGSHVIKYGVVETQTALEDLCEWLSLYVAGRLQKPVKHLVEDPTMTAAIQYNLHSAAGVAVLILGETFTERQLYEEIARLSYTGDPRMAIGGENPRKVRNIVDKQYSRFQHLYGPVLAAWEGTVVSRDAARDGFKRNPAIAEIVSALPRHFRRRVYLQYRNIYDSALAHDAAAQAVFGGPVAIGSGPFSEAVARDRGLATALRRAVARTVAWPALVQTVKGVFSAGVAKSAKYAWEKRLKLQQ